jgi:hypothetical protein
MENEAETLAVEHDKFCAIAGKQEKLPAVIPNPEVPDEYGYSSGWD